MAVTRDHFKPAVSDQTQLDPSQLEIVQPGPQDLPRRDRLVTYPTPDGPTRVGTEPTAPYGEDPHDPTTQAQPRISPVGMVGRLHS